MEKESSLSLILTDNPSGIYTDLTMNITEKTKNTKIICSGIYHLSVGSVGSRDMRLYAEYHAELRSICVEKNKTLGGIPM